MCINLQFALECLTLSVSPQSWKEIVNRAHEDSVYSLVSIEVTSDISAICNASNNMGAETKSFQIKASKSSFFLYMKNLCSLNNTCFKFLRLL